MNRFLITLFLFSSGFIFQMGFPQNQAENDSLLRSLPKLQDTAKAAALIQLFELNRYQNTPQAILYAQEALQIAQARKINKYEARAYLALGVGANLQGDFEKARSLIQKSLNLYQILKNEIGIIDAQNNLGSTEARRGEYPIAIQLEISALQLAEKLKDLLRQAMVLENLAIAYQLSGDLDKALHTYQDARKIFLQLDNQANAGKVLVNIGTIYTKKKDYKSALETHQNALASFEKNNNQIGISVAYNNLGNVYLYQKEYAKAEDMYLNSLKIKEKLGDKKGISVSLVNLAEVYQAQKNYEQAEAKALESLKIAQLIQAKEQSRDAYIRLAEIAKEQGNFKNAYEWSQKANLVKDSLLNAQKTKQIAQMRELYETEKKEQENLLLKNQLDVERLTRNGIIMISILSLLVLGLLVNRFRLKQYQTRLALENEQIKSQKLAAEAQLQQEQIEHKTRELTSNTLYILQKDELLEDLKEEIEDVLTKVTLEEETRRKLRLVQKSVLQSLEKNQDWETFKTRFTEVHPDFFKKLQGKYKDLTTNDLKLCAYLKLSFSTKEIAQLLNNSPRGVETSRYRLRKRLGLEDKVDLVKFLQEV
jgi:tetratricopeptide (TPR) repeat protein/DNA-binding CsgD family transcriptional regulator